MIEKLLAEPCAVCGEVIRDHSLGEVLSCLAIANQAARETIAARRRRAIDAFPHGTVGKHAYGKRKR